MSFYGINHDKTTAVFYKAVHKAQGGYFSDHDRDFEYTVGAKAKSLSFDDDPDEACSCGIHFSHLNWALAFGKSWDDLAILEVRAKIKDVLLPTCSDGKVRAPEVEVIREVPLEECGLLGKFLSKRQKQ
ncbi:MAG: hypothetical protein IJH07_02875 [Ruminococcus sp.]|nr:hypothetical protein [Ruminococcus sp.]